jgi:hypothetical protein
MNTAALLDAAERIVWSFLQAFLGALLASPFFDALGLGWQDALKIALFAGLAAVAKNLLAIALTHNSTPQLGVNTYDNNPDPSVDTPGGIGRNG